MEQTEYLYNFKVLPDTVSILSRQTTNIFINFACHHQYMKTVIIHLLCNIFFSFQVSFARCMCLQK